MNKDTYLSSNGFKLESLLKLSEIRSSEKNTTLLDYLVGILRTKMPEVLCFADDLPHVSLAAQSKIFGGKKILLF